MMMGELSQSPEQIAAKALSFSLDGDLVMRVDEEGLATLKTLPEFISTDGGNVITVAAGASGEEVGRCWGVPIILIRQSG